MLDPHAILTGVLGDRNSYVEDCFKIGVARAADRILGICFRVCKAGE